MGTGVFPFPWPHPNAGGRAPHRPDGTSFTSRRAHLSRRQFSYVTRPPARHPVPYIRNAGAKKAGPPKDPGPAPCGASLRERGPCVRTRLSLLPKQRTRRALTQAELAKRAGVTTATVARIERDEIEPRMTTLRKLAEALGVDPAELVGD